MLNLFEKRGNVIDNLDGTKTILQSKWLCKFPFDLLVAPGSVSQYGIRSAPIDSDPGS